MDRYSRQFTIAASLVCFVAAYALTPSEVRSRATVHPMDRPRTLIHSAASRRTDAVAAIVDPFVPQLADVPSQAPQLKAPLPLEADALSRIGPLPANAGATASLALFAERHVAYVSAIALGSHPSAVIVEDDGPRVVGIGASVGNTSISTIDASGVRLSNGRSLVLSPNRDPR